MAVYHMYILVAHNRLTFAIDLTAFVPESPYIMPIVIAVSTCRNNLRYVTVWGGKPILFIIYFISKHQVRQINV